MYCVTQVVVVSMFKPFWYTITEKVNIFFKKKVYTQFISHWKMQYCAWIMIKMFVFFIIISLFFQLCISLLLTYGLCFIVHFYHVEREFWSFKIKCQNSPDWYLLLGELQWYYGIDAFLFELVSQRVSDNSFNHALVWVEFSDGASTTQLIHCGFDLCPIISESFKWNWTKMKISIIPLDKSIVTNNHSIMGLRALYRS